MPRCRRVRTLPMHRRFTNLSDWLDWQEHLHPNPIDLGLDRVRRVLRAMALDQLPFPVLTVGGTNGKGSCVAFIGAMLRAAGYRIGAYTSPHLLRYNERVCIDGTEVADAEFCAAFAGVDAARADTSLTYFEFGTLAALHILRAYKVDVAVLEVGLGGRLDAVNAVDPDGALVTSVDLDHQEWLGNDRDSIGVEKAGIYRRGRPAIYGERDPPSGLLAASRKRGADLKVLGRDFDWQVSASGWDWQGPQGVIEGLPLPALDGKIQLDNAASSLALLQAVFERLPVEGSALRTGLRTVRIRARFERWAGKVGWVFDVAHNPAAARVLAANLAAFPVPGRTFAVIGMLRDKAAEDVVRAVAACVHTWFVAGLGGSRGQTAAALATRIRAAVPEVRLCEALTVEAACHAAEGVARSGDRIVVFGSFQTVSAALRLRQASGNIND